jgi:hypothetical protein
MNSIWDYLPLFPWEGLPLPRFLGAYWPFAQPLSAPSLPPFTENISGPPATTTYDNIEEVTFPDGFDPITYMPKKIVIHRNAKVIK